MYSSFSDFEPIVPLKLVCVVKIQIQGSPEKKPSEREWGRGRFFSGIPCIKQFGGNFKMKPQYHQTKSPQRSRLNFPPCKKKPSPRQQKDTHVSLLASSSRQPRVKSRYETYLIPGETLILGWREAFHPGIGYASYLVMLEERKNNSLP